MADNTVINAGSGGDSIRDKDRAGVKTQIVGLDVGIGGTEALMSATNPAPMYDPDMTTTGTIAMASTANAVTATLAGDSAMGIAVSGTWTGTLIAEATINGTDWFAVNLAANATGTINTTFTANGQAQALVAACAGFRIRCSVTGTGTANVTLIAAASSGMTKHATPLPAGTNTIGATTTPLSMMIDGTGAAQPLQFAYINVSTAQTGVSVVAAPGASRAIRVVSYAFMAGAIMNLSLIGTGTTLLFPLIANTGISFPGTIQGPAFQCSTNTALTYTTSAAGQFTAHLAYVVV
jgi:hypothetical protein